MVVREEIAHEIPLHPITWRTYSALVQRGGRVAVPPDLSTFRLGQRVYFHVRDHEIAFQAFERIKTEVDSAA